MSTMIFVIGLILDYIGLLDYIGILDYVGLIGIMIFVVGLFVKIVY